MHTLASKKILMLATIPVVAATAAVAVGWRRPGTPANAELSPAAISSVATSQPARQDVSIDNFNFTPPVLTVAVGATVTWVNHDDVPHTVTANNKAFGSQAMDTDERFSHTFAAPGVYPYFCAVHPHMTGQIIVK